MKSETIKLENKAISFGQTDAMIERRKTVVADGVGIFCPSSAVYARDGIITDLDGNELIDFVGGIGVLNAGHCLVHLLEEGIWKPVS